MYAGLNTHCRDYVRRASDLVECLAEIKHVSVNFAFTTIFGTELIDKRHQLCLGGQFGAEFMLTGIKQCYYLIFRIRCLQVYVCPCVLLYHQSPNIFNHISGSLGLLKFRHHSGILTASDNMQDSILSGPGFLLNESSIHEYDASVFFEKTL